jgi:hypothetical protein
LLVLIGKAQAPVGEATGQHPWEWKNPLPDVHPYSFPIGDPQWGPVTLKISGPAPFPGPAIWNAHESVACPARRRKLEFKKEGNCFLQDAAARAQVADPWSEERRRGHWSAVAEPGIYTTGLGFALGREERERSEFHYPSSVSPGEYRRHWLFPRSARREQVFQARVDRLRPSLGMERVKTILGYQRRPTFHPMDSAARRWQVVVEKPSYDRTVFQVLGGRLTRKGYTQGERVRRREALVPNPEEHDGGRDWSRFPRIVGPRRKTRERWVQVLAGVDGCVISDPTLEELPPSAGVGKSRVGGIDLNQPGRRAAEVVSVLAARPRGFTPSPWAAEVQSRGQAEYGPRRATYDLKKLRAQELVRQVARTRRYQATPDGARALTALGVLRHRVIKPLRAAACQPRRRGRPPSKLTTIDQHYHTLRGLCPS